MQVVWCTFVIVAMIVFKDFDCFFSPMYIWPIGFFCCLKLPLRYVPFVKFYVTSYFFGSWAAQDRPPASATFLASIYSRDIYDSAYILH